MNQPSDPYRSTEFNAKAYCDEQISELLDKRLEVAREEMREDVKKLLKQPREVGENVLFATIWRCVALVAIVVTVAILLGTVHGHNTDVQLSRETTQLEHEKTEKAMWDHMNATLGLDGGK
jgi:hypothetical protein